jgi:glycosyltransferase involved in cell wall biosynthesis
MTSRKRVLFFVPAFTGGIGGAERVISTVLRHLDHSRFDCHLALVQGKQAYLEGLSPDVTVHQLGVSRMRYSLPAIVRLVWKLRPQTVLTTVAYLNVMLIAARPFLPRDVRLILREATTPSLFVQNDARHPRLWRWLYRNFYPRADNIICLSDSMLEDMVRNFSIPREKLVRIYNPVDVSMLRQLAAAHPNPYQGKGPHLLVAGRLRKEKGVDLLLEAMPAVLQRYPGARLAVLGEGPQQAELRAQAERLGIMQNVDFWGFQQYPWHYFRNADLFILPSRMEGLPNALLEALALGTPAVASSSVGAIAEIHASNPEMMLVEPDNPAALAQGIISALQKPKADRASLEQSQARLENFDVHVVAEQYSTLF